jgi:hypothetical protein
MSVDFYPNSPYLVTAGYVTPEDSGIKFWLISHNNSQNISSEK